MKTAAQYRALASLARQPPTIPIGVGNCLARRSGGSIRPNRNLLLTSLTANGDRSATLAAADADGSRWKTIA